MVVGLGSKIESFAIKEVKPQWSEAPTAESSHREGE